MCPLFTEFSLLLCSLARQRKDLRYQHHYVLKPSPIATPGDANSVVHSCPRTTIDDGGAKMQDWTMNPEQRRIGKRRTGKWLNGKWRTCYCRKPTDFAGHKSSTFHRILWNVDFCSAGEYCRSVTVHRQNADRNMWDIYYFTSGSGYEVLWWVRLCVRVSVREDISGTTRAIVRSYQF